MIGKRQAWHTIMTLGQETWSDNIGCGMPSLFLEFSRKWTISGMEFHHRPVIEHTENEVGYGISSLPYDKTHGRMKLCVACVYGPCEAHTVEKRQSSHAIIALGKHRRLHYVEHGMPHGPCNAQTV